jgi:hypothetical protein
MRQSILKGYAHMISSVKKRFIDAQKYHGLSTEPSIKLCNQLIRFGFWLMSNEYPVGVLDCTPIKSIRGTLPNGFYTWWSKFLTSQGESEIILDPKDFSGDFNIDKFNSETNGYKIRDETKPAYVIFFQGIQGTGKSTLGNYVETNIDKLSVQVIEQDRFYGCTNSTQGFLYHCINNFDGPDVILITRCNANLKQYERYLDICKKLPTVIKFICPNIVNPLYLSVCLEGVINRSSCGDNLLVGREEFPIEQAFEFIMGNYKEFKIHEDAYPIHMIKENDELLDKSNKFLKSCQTKSIVNTNNYIKWINESKDTLHDLRFSVETIGKQIIKVINDLVCGKLKGINIIKDKIKGDKHSKIIKNVETTNVKSHKSKSFGKFT